MAPLIQCHRLSHSMGTKTLFNDLSLTINSYDRIGLVGHNGSGKSTLLSLLSGEEADSGDISRNNDLHMETVEQFISPALHKMTLLEAVTTKLPREEIDSGSYKAEQLLQRLGFGVEEYPHRVKDLSGGQQNRLMFARALVCEPNLILFDEPTNHLDLRTLLIFEQFLKQMRAAFMIISHDREFLDAVTGRTVFLRDEQLYHFDLPYTSALQAMQAQDDAAQATREQEEKTIKRLEASAKRLATWGRVYDNEDISRKAKSMEKRIDKLRDDKTFVSRGSGLKLTLDVGSAHANRMLHIEHKDINAPDETPLFHIEDFIVRPGERIALLGHNGTGKTTLINLIMRRYRDDKAGDFVKFNPQCDIGYYDQELQLLDESLGLMETLRNTCGGPDNQLKAALIKAGFPYLDIDIKKVSVLSGGEKARLMFLIIKLNQPNFLILDEPTNHIDIQGKEELETQLLDSNATVLITSHDRRFVDTIADRYVLIHQGRLREINDPMEFYTLDPSKKVQLPDNSGHSNTLSTSASKATASDDEILSRIIELETLLEADRARKPKFQKLKSREQWQQELDQLNAELL